MTQSQSPSPHATYTVHLYDELPPPSFKNPIQVPTDLINANCAPASILLHRFN